MEIAHAHRVYKNVPTDFSLKKLNSQKYGIDVTTSGKYKGIPQIVHVIVDTKDKQVTINGQTVASFLTCHKKVKSGRKRSIKRVTQRRKPIKEMVSVVKVLPPKVRPGRRRLIEVDEDDEEAIRALLPKVEPTIFEYAKGLLGLAATGAGWIVWVIQQCLSFLYYEWLVYLGPFSLPLIGIAINIFLPQYSGYVERASMWVFSFVNQPGTVIINLITPLIMNIVTKFVPSILTDNILPQASTIVYESATYQILFKAGTV